MTASRTTSWINVQARSILSDITDKDPFAYSHGLAGVDQYGDYLWVNVLVICFGTICILTLILRLTKMFLAYLRHMAVMGNLDRQAFWANNQTQWWPALKKHLLLAPLWKHRHNRPFQLSSAITNGTLPSRFHTLLLVVYVMSNIAYCLVLPWNRPVEESVVAALRGRSGSLAALNLIPTVLFALRNNPLIPLLKVSYDSFNLLHRWAARLVIIESVIHSLAWLVNTYHDGKWQGVAHLLEMEASYQWGMVAVVVFIFIAIQASAPIRHSFYETFLNIHRIAALVALIGVYVHIDTHHLLQLPWIKIVFTLWGMEWFFRAARIFFYNVSARRVTRVKVEALAGEACRVTFDMVRPWHPRPGCHVHIYLPTISLWASHPFSVAWSTASKHSLPHDAGLPMTEKDMDTLNLRPRSNTLSLIVRARTGMTRKLYDRACASPESTFTTWGAVEGPYGGHDSLASYGTIVLFAAGVGITHQVSFIRELVTGYANGTVAARKVVLVWSITETQCLEWVKPWMDEILALPRRKDVLRIMLFITKPRSTFEIRSPSETVMMFPGRCPVQTILDREIAEREGAVAVTVCGAGGFADSVRVAVRKRVDVGCVDFIEEAFTY